MDISDILKMFSGAQPMGDAATGASGSGQGVAGMLTGTPSPDAPLTSTAAPMAPVVAPSDTPAPATLPGPITPASDLNSGLSGFLSHMVDKATTQSPTTGLSLMDRVGRFGGQMTDMAGDTRGAADDYTAQGTARVAAAKRQQLQGMADQLGMSPREKLLFQADPEAWGKANGDRLGFHAIPGGDTAAYGEPGQPGSTQVAAPKFGVADGEGFSSTPTKTTDTGGLAVSPAQALANEIKVAQQKAIDAYHEHMATIAQQNADSGTYRAHKAPASGGGGGLPPGY